MNKKIYIKTCKLSIGITTSSLQFIQIPYIQRFWWTGLLLVDILQSIYVFLQTVILLQNLSISANSVIELAPDLYFKRNTEA